jgi:hypothetical protein
MRSARVHFVLAGLLVVSALPANEVQADGEALMPGGAQATARGGATAARPTDVMTMLTNPAGLVDLPGNQMYFGLDTAFNSICEQPYGYYGWGVYLSEDAAGNTNSPDDHRSEFGDPASAKYGNRPLDKICNSGAVAPLPQFAWAFHLTERLSVAFGFVAGTAVGGAQWGGKDGTIATSDGTRPTPTRYQAIYQEVPFALNPTGAAAFRVLPWLSLGVTLQVLMASANSYSVTALRAGTSPANDIMTRVHASDYFMPALTFGAYAKPTRRLRFGATFNWSQGLDGSGDIQFTTNNYHQGAVGSELVPLKNDPVKLSRVTVKVPWTATLAARYAQPRLGAKDDGDLLSNEIWDVEIDGTYTANRSVGSNSVEIANDFVLEFRRADGTPQMPLSVKQADLNELSVARHALDVYAVRVGSSWNPLPGRLQLSAGGFLQSRGVDPSYASIDNYAFRRLGLGFGFLVRVGSVDLMASYSHVFQETMNVAPPANQPRTAATEAPDSGFDQRVWNGSTLSSQPRTDPKAPAPGGGDGTAKLTQGAVFDSDTLRARVINAGKYTSSFDVLSLGLGYHF